MYVNGGFITRFIPTIGMDLQEKMVVSVQHILTSWNQGTFSRHSNGHRAMQFPA